MGRPAVDLALITVAWVFASHWTVSPSLAQTSGCVADMFTHLGIPQLDARNYESNLSKHHLAVHELRKFRPYILRLLGVTNIAHGTVFYNCYSGRHVTAPCKRFKYCSGRGTCGLGSNTQKSKMGQPSPPPYVCHCKNPGYSGVLCQKDSCAPSPCENGGRCSRTSRKPLFKCSCRKGFKGRTCQTKTQPCKPNPCRNGGSCHPLVGDFQCTCALGYTGKTCQENWLTEKEFKGTIKALTTDVEEVEVDVKAIRSQLKISRRARSCLELKSLRGIVKSGVYTLQSPTGSWNAYCEMSRSGGGWTRIGQMKPKQTKSCPKGFLYMNQFGGMCARPNTGGGSDPSVSYSPRGISYTEVTGFVNGYQYFTTDAFGVHSKDKRFYVDGVTFRYNTNHHLWSYAGAGYPSTAYSCPCQGGTKPKAFVGSHYYCTQDRTATSGRKWVQLWQGSCGGKNCCVANRGFPWFQRTLKKASTSSIRVSAMCDQSTHDENVAIGDMELYVR